MRIFSDEVLGLYDATKMQIISSTKKKQLFGKYFIYHLLIDETIVLDNELIKNIKMTSNIIVFTKTDLNETKIDSTLHAGADIYVPKNGDFNDTQKQNLVY